MNITANPLKAKISLFVLSVTVLISLSFSQPGMSAEKREVFRVSDRKIVSYEQMIDEIKKTRLVFVGETHDNDLHHRLQLEVLRALKDARVPVAVGFEMFKAESQNVLDRWVEGTISQDDFIHAYYENWNFPWPLYRDILLYVKDHKIPAIGLNLPHEITRKVAASGFSSLTKKELEQLPPDTGCAVDERYMNFIRRAYTMHGHGKKQFLYFCQAQLLWDQVMARNLLAFLKKNPDRTVIVLAGNGHAWKRGIPEQVRILSEKTGYRVILPSITGHIDPRNISAEDADYVLLP